MSTARCPICSEEHSSCGPAGTESNVALVNSATFGRRHPPTPEEPVGLKIYELTQGGRTVQRRLSEADAKLLGARLAGQRAAAEPTQVTEVGDAPGAAEANEDAAKGKRAAAPANKARTAENKGT